MPMKTKAGILTNDGNDSIVLYSIYHGVVQRLLMVTYEFRCRTCGRHFELTEAMAESEQLPECPYCHSRDAELKLSSLFAPKEKLSAEVSEADASNCGSPGPFS